MDQDVLHALKCLTYAGMQLCVDVFCLCVLHSGLHEAIINGYTLNINMCSAEDGYFCHPIMPPVEN